MISVEEGSIGGFAAHVMQFLTLDGACARRMRVGGGGVAVHCCGAAWRALRAPVCCGGARVRALAPQAAGGWQTLPLQPRLKTQQPTPPRSPTRAQHTAPHRPSAGLLDSGKLKFRPMCLPDTYIEHGDYRDQLSLAGLTAGHIAGTALQVRVRACACVRARAHVCERVRVRAQQRPVLALLLLSCVSAGADLRGCPPTPTAAAAPWAEEGGHQVCPQPERLSLDVVAVLWLSGGYALVGIQRISGYPLKCSLVVGGVFNSKLVNGTVLGVCAAPASACVRGAGCSSSGGGVLHMLMYAAAPRGLPNGLRLHVKRTCAQLNGCTCTRNCGPTGGRPLTAWPWPLLPGCCPQPWPAHSPPG